MEFLFPKKKFTTDLLKRFNMLHCKIASTLMNLNEKLQANDGINMPTGNNSEVWWVVWCI